MIRILLVDDQNLVQEGIKSLLNQNPEFKVIGTVKDGRSAVKQINLLNPDIVLLDIEMPGMNGITATKYISRLSPKTKVIILSSHEDKKYLTQALMAGAKGYILKSSLITDLKQSIIAVNNGYSQIESRLLAKIFDPSNIKSNSKKSKTDNRKSGKTTKTQEAEKRTAKIKHSEENKTILTSDTQESTQKSILPQTNASEVVRSTDFVVLSKPASTATFSSPESNKVNTANLKSVTAVSEINLAKSGSLAGSNNQSKSDAAAESSSINVANPFLPAVIIKRSTVQRSRPVKDNLWNKLSAIAFRKNNLIYQIANQQQISHLYRSIALRCETIVQSSKLKLTKYWCQLSLSIGRSQKKGWLANLGLILFGIIITIIIHRLFF